ncbi:MAG: LPP20 family lipoprotein [Porticoccaceae bacterium]
MRENVVFKARLRFLNVLAGILVGTVLTGCATTETKYSQAMARSTVDQDKNIVATGYAVISIQQHSNPAQQRLLSIRASKLDAYRSLMEQIYGQYLDANTKVAEMVVSSDAFRARVHGVVYGARLVSITPVGDDTYETTLSLDRRTVNDLRALYLEQLDDAVGA